MKISNLILFCTLALILLVAFIYGFNIKDFFVDPPKDPLNPLIKIVNLMRVMVIVFLVNIYLEWKKSNKKE